MNQDSIIEERDLVRIRDIVKEDWNNGEEARNKVKSTVRTEQAALDGKPYGNEQEGKSKLVRKEIAKTLLRTVPIITDPFISTTRPIRIHRAKSEEQKAGVEAYINDVFISDMEREVLMEKIAKTFLGKPRLYVFPDWIYSDDRNEPTITVLQPEKVTFDTSVENEQDAAFAMFEEDTTYLAILREQGSGQNGLYIPAQLEKLKAQLQQQQADEIGISSDNIDDRTDKKWQSKDWRRKKLNIVRYFGYIALTEESEPESVQVVWAKDKNIVLSVTKRTFPLHRVPIYGTSFDEEIDRIGGKSLIHYLLDGQRIRSGIARGIMDNLENANNDTVFYDPQKVMPETLLQMQENHKFIALRDPTSAMQRGNFNQIPSAVFAVDAAETAEIKEIAGTTMNSPVPGTDMLAKNQQTQMVSVAQQRQSAMIRKIGGLMRKIFKHILIESEWFLETDQILEYMRSEELMAGMKKVTIGSQIGTKLDTMMQMHQINMLQQQSATIKEAVPESTMRGLVAISFDLMDQPEMAREIRSYKPESQGQDDKESLLQRIGLLEAQAKIAKINAETEERRIKGSVTQFKAQVDAVESASIVKANEALAAKRTIEAQGGSIDNAYKPAEKTKGLEQYAIEE